MLAAFPTFCCVAGCGAGLLSLFNRCPFFAGRLPKVSGGNRRRMNEQFAESIKQTTASYSLLLMPFSIVNEGISMQF
jgi:hypothetical protein